MKMYWISANCAEFVERERRSLRLFTLLVDQEALAPATGGEDVRTVTAAPAEILDTPSTITRASAGS
jgi:hypothetical protein